MGSVLDFAVKYSEAKMAEGFCGFRNFLKTVPFVLEVIILRNHSYFFISQAGFDCRDPILQDGK